MQSVRYYITDVVKKETCRVFGTDDLHAAFYYMHHTASGRGKLYRSIDDELLAYNTQRKSPSVPALRLPQ